MYQLLLVQTPESRSRRCRMIDILLKSDGDLLVTEQGDIAIGDSVSQKIKIRLKWFEGEWRWKKA